MDTGENTQALRKILDFIRMGSIMLLLLHIYCACYPAMQQLQIAVDFVDKIAYNLSVNSYFFQGIFRPKVLVLILLVVSLLGVKGKKDEHQKVQPILLLLVAGLLFFFVSGYVLSFDTQPIHLLVIYASLTGIGYIFILTSGSKITRVLRLQYDKDIFNDLNETFPQETRLLENEYSVNYPTEFIHRNKKHTGYINLVSIFRGTLVSGTPGVYRAIFK